jgi:hypothetical protein
MSKIIENTPLKRHTSIPIKRVAHVNLNMLHIKFSSANKLIVGGTEQLQAQPQIQKNTLKGTKVLYPFLTKILREPLLL